MNIREQKGIQIAKEKKITETPKGYIVPSQSGSGSYLVYSEGMKTACTCPDYEIRGQRCKHIYSILYYTKVEKAVDSEGNTTITKTVRISYKQDWHNYTLAQNQEVKMFDQLLKDLVEVVPEPEQAMGRPRLSLQESLFCTIQKVYSQLSSRRAYSLYETAKEREYLEKAPHYNAINKLLNKEELTPILQRLLIASAMPLKGIETVFIPDSSGFRTSQFGQYCVEKYGMMKKHKWIKAHVLTGQKSNIIVNARITEEYGADCPQFVPLVSEAHGNGFNILEIPADMGYSSRENYNLASSIGATAYIPFKSNATSKSDGSYTWTKMYHLFQLHREQFMEHYHKRSNVESTFNMVKMKFGDRLKSKGYTAQQNELLCKFIAHNIVVLISSMFELGIQPEFCSQSGLAAPKGGEN